MEEDDELIRFDDEDENAESEESDDYSVFYDDTFDDESIEYLFEQVHESIDLIENVMYNMYYTHQKIEEGYNERINTLEQENEKYREEIKKLYQELASNSNTKE